MTEPFVPIVRDQRAALLGVLANISTEEWTRPTMRTPRTVKDAVAHLVENELLFGAIYRGELADLSTDIQAGLERWSKVDGDTVRYSLWHHGQAAQRVMESRSEESWGRPVSDSRRGRTLELRRVLWRHFFELALHGLDVTAALGAQGVWEDRVGPIVGYCVDAAPNEAEVRGGGAAGEPVSVSVPPLATWRTDAETLVLVTTGRLTPAGALARGEVDGDATFLESWLPAWRVAG